jgi:glycosyltransferase involved in cell wall biosynthesis
MSVPSATGMVRPRVCLITTGQPSTNPRLVKEADALTEVGCDVHVIAAYWASWAQDTDRVLMASRAWTLTFIDWSRGTAPLTYAFSRFRHWAARTSVRCAAPSHVAVAALSRVGPELSRAARRQPADLYIAHNLGALPAAFAAARVHGARVGFDAEDFHSGQLPTDTDAHWVAFVQATERRLLPECAYVTAAAPGIAEAYQRQCDIRVPATVLNVFPLRDRPTTLRTGNSTEPIRLYWFSQTIGPNRGLEDVVRAMALVRGAQVHLELRGVWQGGYESRLRELARACGLSNEDIVAQPPAAPDEMVRLAARADIGLALEPGTTVNNDIAISNKLYTYLLAGAAVVASNTSGQSRAVAELAGAAVTYTAGSPESLAAALATWCTDRDALQRARADAWRLGERRFNWDIEKQEFLHAAQSAWLGGRVQDAPVGNTPRLSHA